MLNDFNVMQSQHDLLARVAMLAGFFGSGGLLHATETCAKDIAALAFMNVPDAIIVSEGVHWVKRFKSTVAFGKRNTLHRTRPNRITNTAGNTSATNK